MLRPQEAVRNRMIANNGAAILGRYLCQPTGASRSILDYPQSPYAVISTDGSRIAWNTGSVYTAMAADPSNATRVDMMADTAAPLQMSEDGARLLFVSGADRGNSTEPPSAPPARFGSPPSLKASAWPSSREMGASRGP